MMRACVVGLAVLLCACGQAHSTADSGVAANDTAPDSPSGTTFTVHAGSYYFKPASITIKVGDTVQWIWDGGMHTVTSGKSCAADGKFDSQAHSAPYTFKQTFTEAGTFEYFCDYMTHCEMGQKGTVVVNP